MGLQINWYTQIIEVTSPTIAVSAQALHDFIEDEMASPRGSTEEDILNPEGKIEDPNSPGIYSQIILVLQSPWQVQFWGGSGYTRLYGGKVVGGLSDQPLKATGTAGDISVLESPVDGVTAVVAVGTAVTAQDKIDIANEVWDHVDANFLLKIITNYREVVKIASSWYLIIYDDNGITEIQRKELLDKDDNPISDLVAGKLAKELKSSV